MDRKLIPEELRAAVEPWLQARTELRYPLFTTQVTFPGQLTLQGLVEPDTLGPSGDGSILFPTHGQSLSRTEAMCKNFNVAALQIGETYSASEIWRHLGLEMHKEYGDRDGGDYTYPGTSGRGRDFYLTLSRELRSSEPGRRSRLTDPFEQALSAHDLALGIQRNIGSAGIQIAISPLHLKIR